MDTLTKIANQSTSRSELPPKIGAMFDWITSETVTFQQFLDRVNSPKIGFSDPQVCFLNFALETTGSLIRSRGQSLGIEFQAGAPAVITLHPKLFREVAEHLAPLFDF